MACGASGRPLPDVAWIRNGVMESSGKKATFLKFENINRTDAGKYTCQPITQWKSLLLTHQL